MGTLVPSVEALRGSLPLKPVSKTFDLALIDLRSSEQDVLCNSALHTILTNIDANHENGNIPCEYASS